MAQNQSPHAGHRARMRQRLKKTTAAPFADHELLEMLLYHTNARGDTNETAHALIEAFGSIEGILDADPARLEAVWGIGESSSVLLTLVGELAHRYTAQKFSAQQNAAGVLDTAEKVASFLAPRFIGATKELVFALLLDNAMRPLDLFPVGDGTVTNVAVSVRSIAERAYTKHAAAVILAHNHPGGLATPSGDDIKATHHIKEALSLLEIPLVEHFIFSNSAFTTVLNQIGQDAPAAFVASPLFDRINSDFYKKKGDRS